MMTALVLSRILNLTVVCLRMLRLQTSRRALCIWTRSLRLSLLGCFGILFPAASLAETREAEELSALESKVVYLCEYARFGASKQVRSYWTALADPSLNTANLVALLKNQDPKIRSLAIYALDRKDNPHLLAEIEPLQSDRAPSYRCPIPVDQLLPADKPETWPSQPQTVGDLAGEVIHRYLEVSGYSNFTDYWAQYRDRDYSAGWFILKLRRAWDPFDPAHSGLDTIRREITLLPSPDRQWTVLCLGTISSPNRVIYPYSESEVLRASTELGHDALIHLLDGQIQSTDPTLAAPAESTHHDPHWEWLQAMQTFVLLHARDLLRSSDADLLLQRAAPEREAKNSWESTYREWWPIAAASLKPERSTAILDEAEKRWPESANIPLAHWRIQGLASLPRVLRWFYQSRWRPYGDWPQETLALAIQRARPNRSYEPLVRLILTSKRRLHIEGAAMYQFAALARDWKADFDSQFVDWIYAQPPDAHPELMGPPRGLVVRVSGVSKKLVQDERLLKADAQLLYDIDQSLVGNLNLSRSESVRLDQLILKIDLRKPQNTPESDREEIRTLLRQAVSDR